VTWLKLEDGELGSPWLRVAFELCMSKPGLMVKPDTCSRHVHFGMTCDKLCRRTRPYLAASRINNRYRLIEKGSDFTINVRVNPSMNATHDALLLP